MDIVVAISSYGSHRVKNRHTGKTVSAYKIGYSSAASAVLLALYGDRARDVSSKQASYHYIQIDSEVTVRHGYILLKVSVFPDWTRYLWQAGQSAMLVRPTRTGGDVKLWTIDMDADSWSRLLTGGLNQSIIALNATAKNTKLI